MAELTLIGLRINSFLDNFLVSYSTFFFLHQGVLIGKLYWGLPWGDWSLKFPFMAVKSATILQMLPTWWSCQYWDMMWTLILLQKGDYSLWLFCCVLSILWNVSNKNMLNVCLLVFILASSFSVVTVIRNYFILVFILLLFHLLCAVSLPERNIFYGTRSCMLLDPSGWKIAWRRSKSRKNTNTAWSPLACKSRTLNCGEC